MLINLKNVVGVKEGHCFTENYNPIDPKNDKYWSGLFSERYNNYYFGHLCSIWLYGKDLSRNHMDIVKIFNKQL